MTSDDLAATKQAWKDANPALILHIAKMVKANYSPAQILAEALVMKLAKGK